MAASLGMVDICNWLLTYKVSIHLNPSLKGGWMFHFLKPTKELGQKIVTALRFVMAVAFMMYNKELRRNGCGTTATVEMI